MQKLSLDELQERAGETTTVELMSQISGGTENACHDDYDSNNPFPKADPPEKVIRA